MLAITEEGVKGLDMSFTLTPKEESLLYSAVKQEWFNLIQKMMENEVHLLNVDLLNTSGANPDDVLAKHALAKGAGMFYAGFFKRLQMLLKLKDEELNHRRVGSIENPEVPQYQEDVV